MICLQDMENYDLLKGKAGELSCFLSADEALRCARYRREEDRINFIFSRAILKKVLNPGDPRQVDLKQDKWGKLYCAAGNASAFRHFSLAHTDGMVALVFSASCPVGIDIEKAHPLDYAEILEAVSAPEEMAYFRHAADPSEAFYKVWTLKEACLKLMGSGFLNDPRKLNVLTLQNEDYSLRFEKIMGKFFLSVVAHKPAGEDIFTVRQVTV